MTFTRGAALLSLLLPALTTAAQTVPGGGVNSNNNKAGAVSSKNAGAFRKARPLVTPRSSAESRSYFTDSRRSSVNLFHPISARSGSFRYEPTAPPEPHHSLGNVTAFSSWGNSSTYPDRLAPLSMPSYRYVFSWESNTPGKRMPN